MTMDKIWKGLIIFLFFSPMLFIGLSFFTTAFKITRYFKKYLLILEFCLIVIFSIGEIDIQTQMYFLGESIYFSITSTSVLFVLLLIISLWTSLEINRIRNAQVSLNQVDIVILCSSLMAGMLGFFSGQFMMRYIGLELLGLAIAMITVVGEKETRSWRNFSKVFIQLRLGDLFLLSSILIIYPYGNRLDIVVMLQQAIGMPLMPLSSVVIGFVMAVLVKTATFPFGYWQKPFRKIKERYVFWMPAILMPSLGYYLLYRIVPLIQAYREIQTLIFILSLGLFVFLVFSTTFQLIEEDKFQIQKSVMMCFALVYSTFGSQQSVLVYLLCLIVFLFILEYRFNPLILNRIQLIILVPILLNTTLLYFHNIDLPAPFIVGWLCMTWFFAAWQWQLDRIKKDLIIQKKLIPAISWENLTTWIKSIQRRLPVMNWFLVMRSLLMWIYERVEIGFFDHHLNSLSKTVPMISKWMYEHIELGTEKIWLGVARILTETSEHTLFQYENAGQQTVSNVLDNTLQWIEKRDQKTEKRELRVDLLWIPILLVTIIFFIVISEGG